MSERIQYDAIVEEAFFLLWGTSGTVGVGMTPPRDYLRLTARAMRLRQMIAQALTEIEPDSYVKEPMERLLDALPSVISEASRVAFVDGFRGPYEEFNQAVEVFWLDVWASGPGPETDYEQE